MWANGPSPFPGMDPYLEGHLFQDVHHALANEIRDRLAPHVAPKYVARLMTYHLIAGERTKLGWWHLS